MYLQAPTNTRTYHLVYGWKKGDLRLVQGISRVGIRWVSEVVEGCQYCFDVYLKQMIL